MKGIFDAEEVWRREERKNKITAIFWELLLVFLLWCLFSS